MICQNYPDFPRENLWPFDVASVHGVTLQDTFFWEIGLTSSAVTHPAGCICLITILIRSYLYSSFCWCIICGGTCRWKYFTWRSACAALTTGRLNRIESPSYKLRPGSWRTARGCRLWQRCWSSSKHCPPVVFIFNIENNRVLAVLALVLVPGSCNALWVFPSASITSKIRTTETSIWAINDINWLVVCAILPRGEGCLHSWHWMAEDFESNAQVISPAAIFRWRPASYLRDTSHWRML